MRTTFRTCLFRIVALRLAGLLVLASALFTHAAHAQLDKPKSAPKKGAPLTAEDSAKLAALRASDAFFELWSKFWKRSQTGAWIGTDGKSYLAPVRQGRSRLIFQHCHAPEFRTNAEAGTNLPGEYDPVRSASAFSTCPTWILNDGDEYITGHNVDEADDTDAAIGAKWIDSVRFARARLLDVYDRAQQLLPVNSALTGQRVRFLIDQRLPDSALAVANRCAGDAAFCLLLQGYVEKRRSNLHRASLLFDSAAAQMSKSERCGWRDIASLLPDSVQANYSRLSCTPRQQFITQYWWLADPLYSDSINERRVEHDARAVLTLLKSALARDERFFYHGRDHTPAALLKTVTRYGWPTYLAWGGTPVDQNHNVWLRGFHADTQPPYTTYEYSKGRVHTAPSLSALYSPLSVTDSSWNLYDSNPKDRVANWWPEEHMVRARPLMTLPAYQIAMLRRDSSVVLASAHELSGASFEGLRARGVATLLVTPAPDTILALERKPVNNAVTVRARGNIRSARTLFAFEVSDPETGGLDARTRIGIAPPPTLSTMQRGEIALSDPVILQLASNDNRALVPGESLLEQMLGTTKMSLAEMTRVGVYFESYGVAAGDTVRLTVSLRRRESVSVLRRLGMALNVADDPNSAVTISWTEPSSAHTTLTAGGRVPIQSRAIAIDISALTPGPYDVVTGIKRGVAAEVSSSRRITIVK